MEEDSLEPTTHPWWNCTDRCGCKTNRHGFQQELLFLCVPSEGKHLQNKPHHMRKWKNLQGGNACMETVPTGRSQDTRKQNEEPGLLGEVAEGERGEGLDRLWLVIN